MEGGRRTSRTKEECNLSLLFKEKNKIGTKTKFLKVGKLVATAKISNWVKEKDFETERWASIWKISHRGPVGGIIYYQGPRKCRTDL